jgi:sugar-phosphatase
VSESQDPWSCAAAGLLFDSDGVLVDSDASVVRSWTRWSAHYDLDAASVLEVVHGRRAADTVVELLPQRAHAIALERIFTYELEDAAAVTALPGARELTSGLAEGSWAVVTSATAELAAARLAAAGIAPPPVLVTADDVSAGKPAPDGYALAARRLGAPVADCVVLEDAGSGVAAARAAGVGRVIGVGERALDTDADVVVPDLRSVAYDPASRAVVVTGVRLR